MSSAQPQPTSSSTSVCTHCKEAKQTLKYVIPVPGGKKEFCSESCLTAHRKSLKEAAASNGDSERNSVNNDSESGNLDSTSSNEAISDKKDNDLASTSGERGDRIDRPLSPRKSSSSSSDSEASFSWRDYLKETTSAAAPPSCFKQSPDPPDNEFVVGSKMEAQDPRSQMACIATVIGVQVGFSINFCQILSEVTIFCLIIKCQVS